MRKENKLYINAERFTKRRLCREKCVKNRIDPLCQKHANGLSCINKPDLFFTVQPYCSRQNPGIQYIYNIINCIGLARKRCIIITLSGKTTNLCIIYYVNQCILWCESYVKSPVYNHASVLTRPEREKRGKEYYNLYKPVKHFLAQTKHGGSHGSIPPHCLLLI